MFHDKNITTIQSSLITLLGQITKYKEQKQSTEVFCNKKVFLEISQNPQENTCARDSFLIKLFF